MSTEDNPGNWRIVFEGRSRQACSDRALVLRSLGIPHEIVNSDAGCALLVPGDEFEKAKFELWQYDTENQAPAGNAMIVKPVYQNALPGVASYVLVICLVAWLAGEATFNQNWIAAGRVDGTLIRDGEWWRPVTALTLHSGLGHLLGNIGFGIVFGLFAGSLVGSGVAWLSIVLAGTAGNVLNTLLLDSTHRSIGASTAVFAALGIVAGYSWRAKLMSQERWPYRLGPVIGGIALLAYTGTGDENTDIGAHLSGFVCGFGFGVLLTKYSQYLPRGNIQMAAGIAAVTFVSAAWIAGLSL